MATAAATITALRAALAECALVLAGETMTKGGLVRALDRARALLASTTESRET